MSEIGSEFWKIDLTDDDNNLDFLKIGKDYRLLMSGRTSIDYILNEIDDNKKIVYMPDYCCESMIEPFKDNNYIIKYFNTDVINNKYNIDINCDCSIFFAMSYFGYNSSNMDKYIEIFNKRNVVVIEDITHRFLCSKNYCKYSNYLICSLRKWFPILSGGLAINVNREFRNKLENYLVDNVFIEKKQKAMILKKQYMSGIDINKDEFLELYSESNKMFKNYKNKKIDEISLNILRHIDIEEVRIKRINNCLLIEKMLKNNKDIKLLYKYLHGDCPLFVPVLLNDRDMIRKELIDQKIYLPVHWPKFNDSNNKIYNYELSLVNDQRYSKSDIEIYISKIVKLVGD